MRPPPQARRSTNDGLAGGPDADKDEMRRFAETAEAIAGTSSKLKKIGFLADYLRTLDEDDLRAVAVFFTGKPFALTDARTLNVGWAALVNAVQDLSGASD